MKSILQTEVTNGTGSLEINPKSEVRGSISSGVQSQTVDVQEKGEQWEQLNLDEDQWEASDGDSPFHF